MSKTMQSFFEGVRDGLLCIAAGVGWALLMTAWLDQSLTALGY